MLASFYAHLSVAPLSSSSSSSPSSSCRRENDDGGGSAVRATATGASETARRRSALGLAGGLVRERPGGGSARSGRRSEGRHGGAKHSVGKK